MPERNLWFGVVIQALCDWHDFNTKGRPATASSSGSWNTEKHIEELKWFFFEPEIEEYNLQWIAENVAKDKQTLIDSVNYVLVHGIKVKQLHCVEWDNKRRNKNLTVRKY